jgi:hypothetical protein
MLDAHPFFRFIWRINALALFAAAAVTVVVGGWAALQIARELLAERRVSNQAIVAQQTPDGERLEWGAVDILPGAKAARRDLLGEQDVAIGLGSSGYKTASSTRNILLIDLEGGPARRLFPTSDKLVLEARRLPLQANGAESAASTTGFIITAVLADTDKDGRLTERDDKTLFGWPIGAEQPVELLGGIRKLHAFGGPPDAPFFIVETEQQLSRLDIDPVSFSIARSLKLAGGLQ